MCRRQSIAAALVALVVVLVGGCSSSSSPKTVSVQAGSRLLAFGPAHAGSTLLALDTGAVVVPREDSRADPLTVVPPDMHDVRGGALDLHGTAWFFGPFGGASNWAGTAHPSAPQVDALYRRVDIGDRNVLQTFDAWGSTVVDDQSVLAATYTAEGSTFWHVSDSLIHRVTSAGATTVAGHVDDPDATTLSAMPAGATAPATDVQLDVVQAIVPLDERTFVLLVGRTVDEGHDLDQRLDAAVVRDGTLTKLALPDVCAGQYQVRGTRVDDHRLVVSAPAIDEHGDCEQHRSDWFLFDVDSGASEPLGSGDGLAYLDGDTLITATRPTPDADTVTVAWTKRPSD